LIETVNSRKLPGWTDKLDAHQYAALAPMDNVDNRMLGTKPIQIISAAAFGGPTAATVSAAKDRFLAWRRGPGFHPVPKAQQPGAGGRRKWRT
jgi:hypothetical protein